MSPHRHRRLSVRDSLLESQTDRIIRCAHSLFHTTTSNHLCKFVRKCLAIHSVCYTQLLSKSLIWVLFSFFFFSLPTFLVDLPMSLFLSLSFSIGCLTGTGSSDSELTKTKRPNRIKKKWKETLGGKTNHRENLIHWLSVINCTSLYESSSENEYVCVCVALKNSSSRI